MALNQFMHPRNIYKTPPDFAKLAVAYKEFSNIAKVDVTNKVSINFKDPNALRILTTCLLKSDFNLDVIIPEDRLVPTLPLRLNYVLWIEDLLNVINKNANIFGLDIGTGACAIYPLLAATKNKWHMIGTETDEESLAKAKENIHRNNLDNLIKLKKNTTTSIIEYLFSGDNAQTYDFSMCNPPFYTNFQELWESRSPARPEPKNGFTGSPHELITEGGELQFCRKMIEESKKYKQRILIYTTMVGHKYNLKELILDLKAEGIRHTTTEFCQGRVTRWGLAWTYQDYNFSNLSSPKEMLRKKNKPINFILPELPDKPFESKQYIEMLKVILQNLKIMYKVIDKRKNEITIDMQAFTNSWSNQRRKRRLQKHSSEHEHKKQKVDEEKNTDHSCLIINGTNIHTLNKDSIAKQEEKSEECPETSSVNTSEAIIHAIFKVSSKDNNLYIDAEYISGSAGKEGLHQIVQYIKNNWN